MRRTLRWILSLAVPLSLVGCVDSVDGPLADECGGDALQIRGVDFCVLAGPVIVEEGFRCPQSMPHSRDVAGMRVCSESAIGDDVAEQVADWFEDELGLEATPREPELAVRSTPSLDVAFEHHLATPGDARTQLPMPAPVVDVEPSELRFGQVEPGAERHLPVSVTNNGTAKLIVLDVRTDLAPFVELDVAVPLPVFLAPGDSLHFGATFSSLHPDAEVGTVSIATNDEERPLTRIPVSANDGACVVTDTDWIEMDDALIGHPRDGAVTVENCSPAGSGRDLLIDGASWEGGTGSVELVELAADLSLSPLLIPPGGSHTFVVRAPGRSVGSFDDVLRLQSGGDTKDAVEVRVTGEVLASPDRSIPLFVSVRTRGDVEIEFGGDDLRNADGGAGWQTALAFADQARVELELTAESGTASVLVWTRGQLVFEMDGVHLPEGSTTWSVGELEAGNFRIIDEIGP